MDGGWSYYKQHFKIYNYQLTCRKFRDATLQSISCISCLYSPAFVGRGEKRPLSILLTNSDVQLTLSEIGENEA